MLARAVIKYVRMSPRKVRYVMGPVRGRSVAEALSFLRSTNRRACKPLAKAIVSAMANARQADPALNEEQLVIARVTADGGPSWKRLRAAAFGRAVTIRKPTTHITVELNRPVDKLKGVPSHVEGRHTGGQHRVAQASARQRVAAAGRTRTT